MNNIKNTKITYLLGGLSLILSLGNAGAASTIFRIIEGGTYVQEAPFTVEPHTRLDTLFPGATVVGDAKKTSDNQWAALANSAYVIGGQSTLTRGRDIMEDYQVNFIDPSTSALNYYFEFYSNNAGTTVSRLGYPLTLTGGPMAGQSLLSNNNLLAMGDDNSMWWDATTGRVSYYNYPNGTLEGTTSASTFTGGPYAGLTIASKLSSMIGYESNSVYFLDGSGTLIVYNTNMGFVRTDTVTLSGLLTGKTLGDLVDGKVPGYSYLGWDVGPIVLAASIPEPNGPALLLLTFLLGVLGIRRRSGKK